MSLTAALEQMSKLKRLLLKRALASLPCRNRADFEEVFRRLDLLHMKGAAMDLSTQVLTLTALYSQRICLPCYSVRCL